MLEELFESDHRRGIILLTIASTIGLYLSLAPTVYLWIVLGLVILACGLYATFTYPILLIGILLIIAPTAAYEKRAGLPFIGQLSSISTGQLTLAGLLLIYGLWLLWQRRGQFPFFRLALPLGIWILFTLLSTLYAESRTVALKEWFKWVEIFLLISITLDFIHLIRGQTARLQLLVTLLLSSAVVQGLIGLQQFLSPDGPASFLILGRFFRAFGTFEQPNPYGGFLSWHLLLIVGILGQVAYDQIVLFIDRQFETRPLVTSDQWPVTRKLPLVTGH